jgi:hypothetical protein
MKETGNKAKKASESQTATEATIPSRFERLREIGLKNRNSGRKRTPVTGGDVLSASRREGFTRRWVADEKGRVEKHAAAGYAPVFGQENDTSSPSESTPLQPGEVVMKPTKSVDHNGKPVMYVLMEQEQSVYDLDQKRKQERIDEIEESMTVNVDKSTPTAEGQYGKVSISRG